MSRTSYFTAVVAVALLCGVSAASHSFPWEEGNCPVQHGIRVVVYNSIPKTASTTLRTHILIRNQEGNRSQLIKGKQPRYRRRTPNELCSILEEANTAAHSGKLAIFDDHFYFSDFEHCGESLNRSAVAFVNMMRNPVARVFSRFYYEKAKGHVGQAPCLKSPSLDKCLFEDPVISPEWNGVAEPDLTDGYCIHSSTVVEQSVSPNGKCSEYLAAQIRLRTLEESSDLAEKRELYFLRDEAHNYQTKHLCGQSTECHERSEASLESAITNARNAYLLVGVTEYVDLSWALLWKIFPEFFGGFNPSQLRTGLRTRVTRMRRTQGNMRPSNASVNWVRERNGLDSRLYDVVREEFREKVRMCMSPCEVLLAVEHPVSLEEFYTLRELREFVTSMGPTHLLDGHQKVCKRRIADVLGDMS